MYYFEQGVFMYGTFRCDESWKENEVNIVCSQEMSWFIARKIPGISWFIARKIPGISWFIARKIPGILISCYNFLSKVTNQQS